jgi:Glycine-rich domain-containing protein-like
VLIPFGPKRGQLNERSEDGLQLQITLKKIVDTDLVKPNSDTPFHNLQDLTNALESSESESNTAVTKHTAKKNFSNRLLKHYVASPDPTAPLTPQNTNPHPFSIDLAGAVLRQGSFVNKMNNILWIRSPNLSGTCSRARTKYQKFFWLIAQHPAQVFVPTLDVDLVWHTHQLNPVSYYTYSLEVCGGRFIDHDDKIPQGGEGGLDEGFEETQRLWKAQGWEENYGACLCWFCERGLDLNVNMEASHGESGEQGGLFGFFKSRKSRGPVDEVKSEVSEYRAVEMARREGRPLPKLRARNGPT